MKLIYVFAIDTISSPTQFVNFRLLRGGYTNQAMQRGQPNQPMQVGNGRRDRQSVRKPQLVQSLICCGTVELAQPVEMKCRITVLPGSRHVAVHAVMEKYTDYIVILRLMQTVEWEELDRDIWVSVLLHVWAEGRGALRRKYMNRSLRKMYSIFL